MKTGFWESYTSIVLLGKMVECCILDGESPVTEKITSLRSNPSSMGHMKFRLPPQRFCRSDAAVRVVAAVRGFLLRPLANPSPLLLAVARHVISIVPGFSVRGLEQLVAVLPLAVRLSVEG
ncbi:Calcium-dependent protein kinase [Arachis hypogaea]|nr:Calcium-dependent protein kinase [Arachis hypogaea]